MPRKTYYEILGVERYASQQQVKSSYRRLAKRYHPDLNPNNPQAAQQFRDVQTAYDVLSDEARRREYDRTLGVLTDNRQREREDFTRPSYSAWQRGQKGQKENRRYTPKKHYTGPVSRPHQPRSAYSHYNLEVSLNELFKGSNRSLVVGYTFGCGKCRATGKLETEEGRFVTCERCGGYGFVVSYRKVSIFVPPGLLPDMTLRIEVSADDDQLLLSAPITTNICVTIRLRNTPPFEYIDHQLRLTTEVPAKVLAAGGEWTIPAPEGGEFSFKIPPNTPSGETFVLRRRGLRHGSSPRRGNLHCTVIIAKE